VRILAALADGTDAEAANNKKAEKMNNRVLIDTKPMSIRALRNAVDVDAAPRRMKCATKASRLQR
jgi:hypothetical protein